MNEKLYKELSERVNSLVNLYGNRHIGDEIPKDIRCRLANVRDLFIQFVREFGDADKKNQNVYRYFPHSRPNFSVNTVKFAYPRVYPGLFMKAGAKIVKVKSIEVDLITKKVLFKFCSNKNCTGTDCLELNQDIFKFIYTHKESKLYELLAFLRDVIYCHQIPRDVLFVHAHGMNGTPDSIEII